MKYLFILLLVVCQSVYSCDSVNLGIRSYHWDRGSVHKEQLQNKDDGLIEKHFALGCENAIGRVDLLYFKNSKNKDTLFVGDEWRVKQWNKFSFNVDYGLFFNGYSDKFPFVPAALPKFSWENKHLNINFYILLNQGVALGLEIPLR